MWFRIAGPILGPFAVMTAFMAFAPETLGAHQVLILGSSIGVGLLARMPRSWTVTAVGIRVAYVLAMCYALALWVFFAAGFWFPEAWRALRINV